MVGSTPYGTLQYKEIKGKKMAYIDQGEGDAIVFQHGNPTSSYLWRNVMPQLEGMGRLIACDLIGMGNSDKLDNSGPDSYSYQEHREYLFALWDELDLGDRVTLVLHDWGGPLGCDWANQNRDRVAGIVYMESPVVPLEWSDHTDEAITLLKAIRTPQGETMMLQDNTFIENVLPNLTLRDLTNEEMDHYRQPFLNAGEDRRPMLTWPRSIPISGEPADVTTIIEQFDTWLATPDIPKLFINAEPGVVLNDRPLAAVRTWANQTEITVPSLHFVPEDAPNEIAQATTTFINNHRNNT